MRHLANAPFCSGGSAEGGDGDGVSDIQEMRLLASIFRRSHHFVPTMELASWQESGARNGLLRVVLDSRDMCTFSDTPAIREESHGGRPANDRVTSSRKKSFGKPPSAGSRQDYGKRRTSLHSP